MSWRRLSIAWAGPTPLTPAVAARAVIEADYYSLKIARRRLTSNSSILKRTFHEAASLNKLVPVNEPKRS
jgi:hypothetical protein